jgi:hypothetical protein
MTLKFKIMLILGLCTIISIGSFFIISKIFDNLESQLLEKCDIEARMGARVMSETMNLMIDARLLSESDLFDVNYAPMPGTNPQKYRTRYDALFDKYFQKTLDEFLHDPDVDFAVPADKNGYVPTHNSKYSLPESDDPAQNIHYNRSKRNYSQYPGIKQAILFRGPGTIKTYYDRDTGEKMLNIAAPIKVKDKHWGSFIVGISLLRLTAIKNQMTILIATFMFVIISLTILILIAIMPRKIFSTDLDIPNY